jgi:hypothetical protein
MIPNQPRFTILLRPFFCDSFPAIYTLTRIQLSTMFRVWPTRQYEGSVKGNPQKINCVRLRKQGPCGAN